MVTSKHILLSNSKCYAYTWKGEKLFEGRLTQQAVWRMRKTAFVNRKHLARANERFRGRALGAWSLCESLYLGGQSYEISANSIMEAWANYMATDLSFWFVTDEHFEKGFDIAVLGWHLESGDVHICPVILMWPYKSQGNDFKRLADAGLRIQEKVNPNNLPAGYFEQKGVEKRK
jgi:hypothetical protein